MLSLSVSRMQDNNKNDSATTFKTPIPIERAGSMTEIFLGSYLSFVKKNTKSKGAPKIIMQKKINTIVCERDRFRLYFFFDIQTVASQIWLVSCSLSCRLRGARFLNAFNAQKLAAKCNMHNM